MICIKDVYGLFDVAQSKNRSVQMTGSTAIVNYGQKILINYSTKTGR
ncbi:hypothetical protein HMPREF3212_03892 [Citrobacter freundii]|nr:hypothetical protein HMPREF3212_03892 [Citrobacter freundii]